MLEYNYMKRSILFIPVKILISLLVAVSVMKADKMADIILYTVGTYGIMTTISYISTYIEHLLVTIIATLILSVLTMVLITKIPAAIIFIIYIALVILGYVIDIKKIIRFITLFKNHDKGDMLTESLSKVMSVAASYGYSYDAMFHVSDTSGQTENNIGSLEAKKALMEFKDTYEKYKIIAEKLAKVSPEYAESYNNLVTPLNESVDIVYENKSHSLSDNGIIERIRISTNTVNSIISDAENIISKANNSKANDNNAENNKAKEEKPIFDFFDGCNDKESVKKRYRDLMKTYHPDQGNGSEKTIKLINKQYEILLNRYQ